jgi:hypothetical protein
LIVVREAMTREEQVRVLREQRVGFEIVSLLRVVEDRSPPFADRAAAFDRLKALAPYVSLPPPTDDTKADGSNHA